MINVLICRSEFINIYINNKVNIKILIIIILSFCIFICEQAQAVEFIARGRANEMYDDNINTSPEDPESDWVTNLMLGVALRSEGRTREFELSGNLYQRFYISHEEMNEFYQDMILSINKSFTENITLVISDTFQNYPSAQSFGAMFERGEDDEGYMRNDFASGLTFQLTRKLFFTGVYNNTILKNDNRTIADSVLHSPGAIIEYYFNSANIVRAGYMYSLMKYDDGSESKGERGYVEYEKFFTNQLRGIVNGGYDYVRMADGESLNTRYMASLIDEIDERNELNISFLKESTISNITNDTLNNWRISAAFECEVSSRTSVDMTLFYGEGVYEVSRVRDKLGGFSSNLSFAVSEFVDFEAGYTFVYSSSKRPGLDEASYNRNQVYVGVSGEY